MTLRVQLTPVFPDLEGTGKVYGCERVRIKRVTSFIINVNIKGMESEFRIKHGPEKRGSTVYSFFATGLQGKMFIIRV